MRKITTEEFIVKAKERYGDRFDYSNVEYIRSKLKVIITCKQHGDFEQTPNNHLNNKGGCGKCFGLEKWNTTKFIERANEVHNNKYDYSKVEYIKGKSKVIIICKEHGEFTQQPNSHINSGQGCAKCKGLNKKTTQEFIIDSKAVHGELYDYSKSEYKNSKTLVTIICKTHGEFLQLPNCHTNVKQGCPKCINTYKLDTKSYIEKATDLHSNFYSYDKLKYINSRKKVVITCPIHGDFLQNPSSHLQKVGCPTCSQGYYSMKRAERHKEKWENVPAILYFLKIITEDEEFYKVGLTKKTIKDRFKKDEFKIEIIKEYNTNLYQACILESVIIEENRQYSYKPKNVFGGYTECFYKNILE